MPPKVNKKQVIVESTPVVSNKKSLGDLMIEWTDVVKNITILKDQIGPLETKRDSITSQMLSLMDNTTDSVDSSSIIETTTIPMDQLSLPVETGVKGKGKGKSKPEQPEAEPVTKKAPVKKTAAKKVDSDTEVTIPTKVVKGKKTKEPEPEVEIKSKVTKTPVKTKTPVSKGKPKLDEDSETDIPVKQGYVSSSETDLESLSSCSSDSENSGGEDE